MTYKIEIGPERQPFPIRLPQSVVLGIFENTYPTRDEAQDALDTLAETIEAHNPEVHASAGLYALEINDVPCYCIEEA